MNLELKVIPVVQVGIAVVLMSTLQHFFPAFNYPIGQNSGSVVSLYNLFVALLFITALLLVFLAIYSFQKHQTTVNPSKPESSSKVVDSGIYQYSRNPMYLAMLLGLLAYGCMLKSFMTLPVCGLFIWYISRFQIIPEERMLLKLFGDEYKQYKSRVRRWL